MGRVTYEQMSSHWPSAAGEYAAFMNNLPKVVFSTTLPVAEWAGSRIARGDLTEEIAALKSEPGGEIMAHGGAAFAQALSRFGLVDEYRLVILPVVLGNGLPLFKDLDKPLRVDLAEPTAFPRRDGHPRLPADHNYGVTPGLSRWPVTGAAVVLPPCNRRGRSLEPEPWVSRNVLWAKVAATVPHVGRESYAVGRTRRE
jgi:dihydrofolate reductase